jgi:hypothetical protein
MTPIYHGSNKIITEPEFGKGRPYNDYGLGFYLSDNRDIAGEWAVIQTERDGYINEYTLDYTGLQVLNLDKEPLTAWIAVLVLHRTDKTIL